MIRVGQNHIYTVCIRYFWQRNHRMYGHIRCIYTVLANPSNDDVYTACVPFFFFLLQNNMHAFLSQMGTFGLTKGVRLPDAIWLPQEEASDQQQQQQQRRHQ